MKQMNIPCPFRYASMEDVEKVYKDFRKARELSILPFIEKNGRIIINPDYENAPYELGVFTSENTSELKILKRNEPR